jgi:hypothetical protein
MSCSTTVHENVCVQALVRIRPDVTIGDIDTFCLGNPAFGPCTGTAATECTFTVHQEICVQVPITFGATATATSSGIVCGTPAAGECRI